MPTELQVFVLVRVTVNVLLVRDSLVRITRTCASVNVALRYEIVSAWKYGIMAVFISVPRVELRCCNFASSWRIKSH